MKTKLIIAAVVAVLLLLVYGLIKWKDPMYVRAVNGMVVTEGSRYSGVPMASGQKFAILLSPYTASDEVTNVGGGDGSLAIECLSTRCAILNKGTCADFDCRIDHRLWEPSVIQCKMVHVIPCGATPKS